MTTTTLNKPVAETVARPRAIERIVVGQPTSDGAGVKLTRGGKYRNTPADTQVPYLKTVFTFLGLTDVQFVYAEGLAMGPESEQKAIASAHEQIEEAVASASEQIEEAIAA